MTQSEKFVGNQNSAESKLEQDFNSEDLNTPTPNQSLGQPFPKREPLKHLRDWFSQSRYQNNLPFAANWLRQCGRLESIATNR